METNSSGFPFKNVLVAFDGSAGSSMALRTALLFCKGQKAEITVLSVAEHTQRFAPGVGEIDEEESVVDSYFGDLERKAMAMAEELGQSIKTVDVLGEDEEAIVHYAKAHMIDLIVIGRSAHSGLLAVLLGSTSTQVVDKAPCDVLVVR